MQFTRLVTLLVTGFCLLSMTPGVPPVEHDKTPLVTLADLNNISPKVNVKIDFKGTLGGGKYREEAMKLERKTREDKANESLWAIHATRPVWEDDR
ncbi:MAG: hypothetical protein M1822_006610 [Bathelium mastoideum]|nr:MAG: hypothetical protein M1822_006610 [Bathelium mastoideum]